MFEYAVSFLGIVVDIYVDAAPFLQGSSIITLMKCGTF